MQKRRKTSIHAKIIALRTKSYIVVGIIVLCIVIATARNEAGSNPIQLISWMLPASFLAMTLDGVRIIYQMFSVSERASKSAF
jgi:hypothetical protein